MPPFLLFIMAGGSGERFWPLSRKAKPKHLLKLVSSKTLLEETVLRIKPLASKPSHLLILTNHEQIPGIRKALPRFPKSSLIPEPAKRDTAPAAALATALALRNNRDATLALLLLVQPPLSHLSSLLASDLPFRQPGLVTSIWGKRP